MQYKPAECPEMRILNAKHIIHLIHLCSKITQIKAIFSTGFFYLPNKGTN